MAATRCASRKTAIVLLIVSSLMLLVSILVLVLFPAIYKSQLHEQIVLVKNTLEFGMWKHLPLPIYQRLYFFNITNSDAFLNDGANLNVSQVGPYTYKGNWLKDDVSWYANKTVSYRELRTYHFVPELSSGSQEDEIYTLNGPFIMASDFLKDASWEEKLLASIALGFAGEEIIILRSVKQLAYDGYYDVIIHAGKFLKPGMPFKGGQFSWLYGKNDTYDGQFTVFTGVDDINKLNVIDKWNGESKLDFWKNDSCNMLNGSSAEMSPPLEENQTEYTFFQSFFCRSLTFDYSGQVTNKGVKARRFVPTEKVFGNATVNADNACFDTKPYLRTGVLDLSTCQFGAPVVLSFPHFYLADPSYLSKIEGLNPNDPNHMSYLDIEPTTGISVSIALKFQLNLELTQVKHFLQFNDVPEGIFPVLWADVQADITDDLAHMLKTSLNTPKYVTYSVLGIVIAGSVIMFIAGVVICIRSKMLQHKEDDDEKLINGSVRPSGTGPPEDQSGIVKYPSLTQQAGFPDDDLLVQ